MDVSLYVYQRKRKIADLVKRGVSPGSIAEFLGIPETQVRQEYREYLDDMQKHIQMSVDQVRCNIIEKIEYIEEKTVEQADQGSLAALNLQLRIAVIKGKLYADPFNAPQNTIEVNAMPMVLENIDDLKGSSNQQLPSANNTLPVQALKMDELKRLYIEAIGYQEEDD